MIFRKSILIALACTLLIAIPAAAEVKIGFIDSARIFAEYKGRDDAQRTFDEEAAQWETQAKEMKATLDSLEVEYQRQALMLSETRKKERQEEIIQHTREYEEFVQTVWGPQGKLADKNSQLIQPIVEKINVILSRKGDEEGYTLILDNSLGGIVYAGDGIDITDEIIAELNEDVQ